MSSCKRQYLNTQDEPDVWGDTSIVLAWVFRDAGNNDTPVTWLSGTIRILDPLGVVQVNGDGCRVEDDAILSATDASLEYSPAFGGGGNEIRAINRVRGRDCYEYTVQFRGVTTSGVKHSKEFGWFVRPPL